MKRYGTVVDLCRQVVALDPINKGLPQQRDATPVLTLIAAIVRELDRVDGGDVPPDRQADFAVFRERARRFAQQAHFARWPSDLFGAIAELLDRASTVEQGSPMPDASDAFDIAIICALPSELKKVLRTGTLPWTVLEVKDQRTDPTNYWTTTFPREQGQPLRVVAAAPNQMGMPAAAVLATKMVRRFQPTLVATVGIAAGVKGGGRGYGDILAPDHTFDYGAGKIGETAEKKLEFLPDPRPINIYPLLLARLQFWKDHMQDRLARICEDWEGEPPGTVLKLHVGPLGSGAPVVAASPTVDQVRDHWRKLIGLEMEAYGVHLACQEAVHPPPMFLCMKSVCDFADAEKKDDWQSYAAYTAARLFYRFVTEEWDRLFPH